MSLKFNIYFSKNYETKLRYPFSRCQFACITFFFPDTRRLKKEIRERNSSVEQFITFASQYNNEKLDTRVWFHIAVGATIDMNTSRRHIFGLLVVAIALQADVVELHALTWNSLATH